MFKAVVKKLVRKIRHRPAPALVPAVVSPPPPPAPAPAPAPEPPRPVDGEPFYTAVFDYDGLRTNPAVLHNHDFMRDPRYVAACRRGVQAHGEDPKQYWRLHVALWCAAHAITRPEGAFVECGVWKGYLSSAIMRYLDWNSRGRHFYLFDTFRGIDESQVTAAEFAKGNMPHYRKHYLENYESVVRNFSEFRNVHVIRGSVPGTLRRCDVRSVAYLSLDMNNVTPEIAAINHFWDRLVPGAVVLLDDYGFVSYEEQKKAFDAWTRARGVEILALPSGQGMFFKP